MNILKKLNFSILKISFPNQPKKNILSYNFLKLDHLNFCENTTHNSSKKFKSLYKKKIYHDTSKDSNEKNFQSLKDSDQGEEMQSQKNIAVSDFKQNKTNSNISLQSYRDERINDIHKEFLDRMVKLKFFNYKIVNLDFI
jgi:hypothetical protein